MYVNHPLVLGRLPTKASLPQRLHIRAATRAATRRPPLADLHIHRRDAFAYSAGQVTDGEDVPLMRLRYTGSAVDWGFGLYLASKDGYEDAVLPAGTFTGTPEEALDCVCERNLSTPGS